ncbi:ABC transporter ATP-binding protein [Microbacterium sp. SORGH_AS_0862]|uniref:ABC transporter ATP-binding protein n=1 Tax=Microbacterium sp. SORGH_AS_0862 TaxID=3041789 RepID=UPI002792F30C|nr:ABC transporter ATP-binding protein [Microbacterium sp. SORGH_AS_0862]MDQ1205717.1 ABC-type glutathione transport system ATPase component [Microbacterium sp. SORGH_AS_0862]
MSVLLSGRGLRKSFALPKDALFARATYRHALQDVDIDIEQGVTTALIGESGSGKSTLIRVLLGLRRADAGRVMFDEHPIEARRASQLLWLRRQTGIVLQDPYASLDPRFTIAESIAEPLQALRIGGDHRARVLEVLEQVQLPAWRADQYPHELSGGQRQRVALARAIVHRPRLLVGDEPLSALDVTVRAQVLELLRDLREQLGLTIVLVSHDIGLVQHVADRVAVMKDGRLVESGRAESVLRAPAHPYTRSLLSAVPRLIDKEAS